MQKKKPLNVAIGRRIQLSREDAGLTQEQLAEQIGRSTQFISTVERGLAGPSLETIVKLCDALHVSAEWILRGNAPSFSADSIAAKLSALSPRQLTQISQMADELLALLRVTQEESAPRHNG